MRRALAVGVLAGLFEALQSVGDVGETMRAAARTVPERLSMTAAQDVRVTEADRVCGGCVEGQELGGATTPGRVGADGHDRSFVEEGGQGAAEVRAGGVQCLAELRTRRRGEGEVGDDTVLEGGEGWRVG